MDSSGSSFLKHIQKCLIPTEGQKARRSEGLFGLFVVWKGQRLVCQKVSFSDWSLWNLYRLIMKLSKCIKSVRSTTVSCYKITQVTNIYVCLWLIALFLKLKYLCLLFMIFVFNYCYRVESKWVVKILSLLRGLQYTSNL